MKKINLIAVVLLIGVGCASDPGKENLAFTKHNKAESVYNGFYDFRWDQAQGKIFLHVSELKSPFIYQTSLARGIGSNDLGADRGRLDDTKLVEFFRSGSKLLLIEKNTAFRAQSTNNVDEQNAVEESFAQSVIWGFTIEQVVGETLIVDATDFLLRDALSMGSWLKEREQGSFSVDAKRSAIYLPRTRAFTDNTEFESIITLTGVPEGDILSTVVPDPTAISVHMHHSFVRLPKAGYEPLAFDPRSGFLDPEYGGSFADYAVPIGQPINKAYARRHRLKKNNPNEAVSVPVKPIIYYLDRGVPEPVRSALLDGAGWWNQAFEAAGYINAFQIKMLPADADPLDVRYNVIQWVHRSTRGWSYGSSVVDPRTGEIIKGHVSLGSLRVRQDYLLAEGLLAPYGASDENPAMEAFALSRIRQLSAHEVGHTLGLEHNFAGSVNQRASVMDYPFPLITLSVNGEIDISNAYAEGIGDWDKRAILWGYQEFPANVDAAAAREDILRETYASGLKYVADNDSRNIGAAHIDGNLWDNGADPVTELQRLMKVRTQVLNNFSSANIPNGRSMATLEEVLVPMYLLHRYQLQAAGKVLGGGYYHYDFKGDGQAGFSYASAADQKRALSQLLGTLTPQTLLLPEKVAALISPRPPGYALGKETFDRKTGPVFDRYAPADAAITLVLDVLLEPGRGERLSALEVSGYGFGLSDVMNGLLEQSVRAARRSGPAGEIQRRLNSKVIERLIGLVNADNVTQAVRGSALAALKTAQQELPGFTMQHENLWRAHDVLLMQQLKFALENKQTAPPFIKATPPPGSPIGD